MSIDDKSTDRIASHIIRQIESLGYHVSVHRMTGGISISGNTLPVPDVYVEMHAHDDAEPPQIHVARVEGEGPDTEYTCACELAQMVGIELEEG